MRYLITLLLVSQWATAQPHVLRTFDGTVGSYPVSLTLTTTPDVAVGTLVYKKKGKPIRVVGRLSGDGLQLREFNSKATITGIFSGTKAAGIGDVYSGTWSAPRKTADLKFSLRQTSQRATPTPTIGNLTGTYAYTYGNDAGNGQISVLQTGPDKLTVAMQAVMGAPAYNQAIVPKKTVKLDNSSFVYAPADYPGCRIRVTFFAGGAGVEYIGEEAECGFGHNASIVGSYVKTSSKKPVFQDF